MTAHDTTPAALAKTARDAAEAAAAVHLEHAGRHTVESASLKATSDFVTEVDTCAQAAALGVIRARFPHHRILAEEDEADVELPARREVHAGQEARARREVEAGQDAQARTRGEPEANDDAVPLWIVDPLDGTTNYLHRHPMYCASVGVTVGGVPVAGAVTAPESGERWWAHEGGGAWKSGPDGEARAISVSPLREFGRALIGTGFPFRNLGLLPAYLEQFERVLRAGGGIRRGGSAAMDLCFVAEGIFDAFWELSLSPWDVAAGAAIVREAGGRVTRVGGEPLDVEAAGSILASGTEEVRQALSTAVHGVPQPPAGAG